MIITDYLFKIVGERGDNMEDKVEIIERDKKPFFPAFLSIVGSVVIINFIIFLLNKIIIKLPYLTNIIVLFLVVSTCSLIIIKYFSKYVYILQEDELIFSRAIGKKTFNILKIDLEDILYIKNYTKDFHKRLNYKFVFDKDCKNHFVGEFKKEGKRYSFSFNPSASMLNEINKKIKKLEVKK